MDWFALAILLQQQSAICIAKEDRRFLAQIVNEQTLDNPPPLMQWQKKWILALKKECRL